MKLNGKSAAMSPKQKRVVIAIHKSTTYNYTLLPGNNTRGGCFFPVLEEMFHHAVTAEYNVNV